MAGQHWALAAKPPSPPGERDLGGTPAAATIPTPFWWEAPRRPARCQPQTHHSESSSSPIREAQDPGLHVSSWRPREEVMKEQ